MKRTLSLILIALLLVGLLPLAISTEAAVLTTSAFEDDVMYSVTDSNQTGWGLAFAFTLNAKNVGKTSSGGVSLANAKLTYKGTDCKITCIGAVVTHMPGIGQNDKRMIRETAVGRRNMQDVKVTRMYRADSAACTYAIRIINIPYEREQEIIYARPYVEIEYEGEKITLYGKTDSAHYAEKAAEFTVSLPFYGADIDGKGRLFVGDASALGSTLYLEIQDELDDWMVLPQDDSYIKLGFYDAEGNLLAAAKEDEILNLPGLGTQNATVIFEVTMPAGTASVKILETQIRYWSEWE